MYIFGGKNVLSDGKSMTLKDGFSVCRDTAILE
jgi:hypothetical protein